MIKLHDLKKKKGSTHRKKVVGRGLGSGKGTYSTRGGKGQTARTGHSKMPARFEGTQPIIRQTPKSRGFRALNEQATAVALDKLSVFNDGDVVTLATLKAKGIVKPTCGVVKILAGKISKKLEVRVPVSKTAAEAITKAGGKVK